MIDHIHLRLVEWSRFMRAVRVSPRGYPSQTMESAIKEMGGVMISGDGPRIQREYPQHIRETERAVTKLPENMRDVVIAHYTQSGRSKHKAHAMGLNRMRYYATLDSAHVWLEGYFAFKLEKSLEKVG